MCIYYLKWLAGYVFRKSEYHAGADSIHWFESRVEY